MNTLQSSELSVENEKEKLLWEFKEFKDRFSEASHFVSKYNNIKRKSERLIYNVEAYCLDLIYHFVPIITSQLWDFVEDGTKDYLKRQLYLKNYDTIIEYVSNLAVDYFIPSFFSLWIIDSKIVETINKQNSPIIKIEYLFKYLENNKRKEEIWKRLILINSELFKVKIKKLLEENLDLEKEKPLEFWKLLKDINYTCIHILGILESVNSLSFDFGWIKISMKENPEKSDIN